MILRRLTKHVKDQNWFAVGLDFVIVVAGVFVGLQVSNWNAASQERARGAVYAERLKSDMQAEYVYATSLGDYYLSLKDATEQAYLGLSEAAPMDDETILINAFRASQYNWYERRRSTFDELVASGALALVRDDALSASANWLYSTPLFEIIQSEGQSAAYRELFRMAIEPALHDELGRKCGDRDMANKGGAIGLLTLDYACALEASDADMAEGVRALRSEPGLLRALKLRNAQVDGRISDLEMTVENFGLNDLFGEVAAP